MSVEAVVALGANLGDPSQTLRQALEDLAQLPQTRLLRASSLYRSAPVDASGPDFINAAAVLDTTLEPLPLLHALQTLEQAAGRERPYRNAPRTLDLDLIFYGDVQLQTAELTLPHPRWRERAFVLHPLAEVCPERISTAMLQAVQGQAIERLS